MAKFSSYYTLSPLIDQQNLLGVEKDSNPGCAVITLGRNIVNRYKLQDAKQISSWSTKEKLTSQVIYNHNTKTYAAVFDEKYIRVWSEDETEIDNMKKLKFHQPLHSIVTLDNVSPILVLKNGNFATLKWAIDNRKTWSCKDILNPGEIIIKCQMINVKNQIYLCLLTRENVSLNLLLISLEEKSCLGNVKQIKRLELKRDDKTLIGNIVIQDENDASILTFWSDNKLYSHSLIDAYGQNFPGNYLSVIEIINTKYPVVMTSLDEKTIALYGADSLEEGAVLLMFNLQFKLIQAVQKLKLHASDARLWTIYDKLLLSANRHLSVAPFQLVPQSLEHVVGSSLNEKTINSPIIEEVTVIENKTTVSEWQGKTVNLFKSTPKKLPKSVDEQLKKLIDKGLNNIILPQVIIPLLIESKDISSIIWCIDNFRELPEKLLVNLLSFCLNNIDDKTKILENGDIERKNEKYNEKVREDFLNKILKTNYTDIHLLSHLKNNLSFNQVLELFQYLVERLEINEKSIEIDDYQYLYQWTNLLLDSHYQHYLLAQDPRISEQLMKLQEILQQHFELLKELEDLRPMLIRIINGKPLKPLTQNFNKFYSIEEVRLY